MATTKQTEAARRNIKKAAAAAKSERTITKLPKKTHTALGKKGAQAAKAKRQNERENQRKRLDDDVFLKVCWPRALFRWGTTTQKRPAGLQRPGMLAYCAAGRVYH